MKAKMKAAVCKGRETIVIEDVPVSEAMDRQFITVGPRASLDRAYQQLFGGGKVAAAVVEDGTVRGVLCPEGLSRFLGIGLALKGRVLE